MNATGVHRVCLSLPYAVIAGFTNYAEEKLDSRLWMKLGHCLVRSRASEVFWRLLVAFEGIVNIQGSVSSKPIVWAFGF